ncbi:MAG: alpha-D-ribose 1-methylphosphonate 5-triphosphate diphosphatase [Pseudomonadota bacterium]
MTSAASPAAEICLANARIVLVDRVVRGAVHVAGGKISAISEGASIPRGALDLGGDVLMPGLVELHTDNLEHHLEPRPKAKMPHLGAILAHDGEMASVGITTVYDALRVGSSDTGENRTTRYARQVAREILELSAQDALRARHLIHLRAEICSETLIEELSEFGPGDRVGLVSMMDHTPGQRQFRDLAKFRIYNSAKHGFDEARFAELVRQRQELGQKRRAAHKTAILEAATRLGAPLASHDDTSAAHVAASAASGVQLAEFPTTLEAAQACRDAGIAIMMGAPNLIRGGSHAGNVSAEALAREGSLDIMSSDYVPSLLLASAFRLAALWGDLPRGVATVTAAPARAAGLDDRGEIAQGRLADLVRVRDLVGTPVIRAVWRGGERIA